MRAFVAGIAVVFVLAGGWGSAMSATGDSVVDPVVTAPVDSSAPPDSSSPPPASSLPTSSTETTSGLVGVDSVGADDATTATWLAIIGALALVAVAAWWMVRSSTGSDDRSPSRTDDDWPSDSEVI